MNLVLRHIEYLLTTHDCVVVPGLGAFLACHNQAVYDGAEGVWIAPRRRFTFNRSLNVSDGLLPLSIARSCNIEYDAALNTIEKYVAVINRHLELYGEFVMGRIGRLELSMMGEMSFVPYSIDRLTPLANWLPDIEISEIGSTTLHHKASQHNDKVRIADEIPPISRFNRFVRTVAGIAAAILIAIVASTPISTDNMYTASTVPHVTTGDLTEVAFDRNIETVETKPEQQTATKPVAVKPSAPAEKPRVVETKTETETKIDTGIRFDETDSYVVVVASLASRKDAQRFIDQNKAKTNVSFGIVENNSNYRVYVATGQTYADASKQLRISEIASRFDSGWVAKKY